MNDREFEKFNNKLVRMIGRTEIVRQNWRNCNIRRDMRVNEDNKIYIRDIELDFYKIRGKK